MNSGLQISRPLRRLSVAQMSSGLLSKSSLNKRVNSDIASSDAEVLLCSIPFNADNDSISAGIHTRNLADFEYPK